MNTFRGERVPFVRVTVVGLSDSVKREGVTEPVDRIYEW